MRFPFLALGAFGLLVLPSAAAPAQGPCELQKLLPADPGDNDRFGDSIATDGASVIVGAHDKLTGSVEKGSAYVYVEQAGSWVQQGKLVASDAAVDDEFGHAVEIQGSEAFISNPKDDFGTSNDQGSVYAFVRHAGAWVEADKLAASDGQEGDLFGDALDRDGDHLVVGASGAPLGELTGAAYFFERAGEDWLETQRVSADDGVLGDRFGWDVAVDGEWAFVSAFKSGDLGEGSGSVYVYRFEGGVWTAWQKLLPSDGSIGWGFGDRIDVDGDLLAVSASGQPSAIYVFRLQGLMWVEEAKLTGGDAGVAGLGSPVAVSGPRIAGGASYLSSERTVLFEHTGTSWEFVMKPAGADVLPEDEFANDVALAGDLLAVGAFWKAEGGLDRAGAAYLFDATAATACMTGNKTSEPAPFVGQQFTFAATPAFGSELYLLLGSLSGTTPGFPFGSVLIPLNLDIYGLYTVAHPNQDPLFSSFGALDAFGGAPLIHFAPSIDVSSLVGVTVNHACIVIQGQGIALASNPIGLLIEP